MNKILIDRMRLDNPGLTTAEATKDVERVFTALRDVLEVDERVRIPGFGTFKRKFRDAARRRNPRTGEAIITAPHHVITFKQAKPK